MTRPGHRQGQAGFTLIEILVALILISLLVAAVFPVVTQQARQADAPRLANDLTNIGLESSCST
jgi:prepilin-type N-terminal cleavage/methylation domain-containing protein